MAIRYLARVIALTLVSVLAAGCGSDDSSRSVSEPDRVKRVFDDWQHAFGTGDGVATCTRLTEAGRGELLRYRRVSGYIDRSATCEEVVEQIVQAAEKAGVEQQPAKAISARVEGNRAVVQVIDGGRPPRPVRMVKQRGRWMFPTAGLGSLAGDTNDGS